MATNSALAYARKWLRDMARLLPCGAPVRVVFVAPESGSNGSCEKTRTGFIIRVNDPGRMARADLESEYVRLVLLHEYAHAREWPRVLQPGSPDHGAHWGVEVAAVTRVESGEG